MLLSETDGFQQSIYFNLLTGNTSFCSIQLATVGKAPWPKTSGKMEKVTGVKTLSVHPLAR